MWLLSTHAINAQRPTAAARKMALEHLVRALDEATESGLFDNEFLAECLPDAINEFCDAAERLQEAM